MTGETEKDAQNGKACRLDQKADESPSTSACPVCGGRLIEIRGKLQCSRCRTICETCCEGGRG